MEHISALMDGELPEREADREVAQVKADPGLRERWDEFHLIGDVLRREPLLSPHFGAVLARRLAEEPTVLAPRRVHRPSRPMAYAMSAAASVSAAALVAWVALAPTAPVGDPMAKSAAPKVAAADDAPAPAAQLANVPSDGRMNEYLLAHEGFSPSTALQGVAPYIRTVSAIRPAVSR
jgi:sigma-E factor negative regulatory protein RseA